MQVLRLVDPAQDRVLAGEDLHRDDGVEALALEDRLGAGEVDVGRVAGQDLARRPGADEAHQRSRLTMRLPCRWALDPGRSAARRRAATVSSLDGWSASVAYGPGSASPGRGSPAAGAAVIGGPRDPSEGAPSRPEAAASADAVAVASRLSANDALAFIEATGSAAQADIVGAAVRAARSRPPPLRAFRDRRTAGPPPMCGEQDRREHDHDRDHDDQRDDEDTLAPDAGRTRRSCAVTAAAPGRPSSRRRG